MAKKITKKWLNEVNACQEGVDWFLDQNESDPVKLLRMAINSGELEVLDYAIWGITRLLTKKNNIRFAIYCAEKVIHIFENSYPEDKRPRQAIQAAKRYLKNMTKENRNASFAAANAAASAAADAYAAADNNAWAAANAAASAAAYAAGYGSGYEAAGSAAAYAADDDAKKAIYIKFINYGIKIIKESK